jgi:hypothetical protein
VCVKAENQPEKQIPKTNTQKLKRFKRKIFLKKTPKIIPIKSQDPEDLREKRTKKKKKKTQKIQTIKRETEKKIPKINTKKILTVRRLREK